MKHVGLTALFSIAVVSASWAAPVQQWGVARVKSVKIYPAGVYVTLSVTASLKGVPQERVIFPDLWYADRGTVDIKLAPGTHGDGVTLVPEISPAAQAKNTAAYRQWQRRRDAKSEVLGRLRSDSMSLAREIGFLEAKTYQSWKTLSRTEKAGKWLKGQYMDLYERQRRVREEILEQQQLLAEDEKWIAFVGQNYSNVTLAWVWVEAPGPREVEFEVSYYANAAEWKPVYFFRFDSNRSKAVLDYRATVCQWTGFNWDSIPAALSYGFPAQTPYRRPLYRRTVDYRPPAPKVKARPNDGILDLDVEQQMVYQEEPDIHVAAVAATETDVSYRLPRPLSLVYSSNGAQTYQTVQVRRDTIPVLFDYEVTPKVSDGVLLTAHIPDWQRLYLTSGRMTVFCDGRMLGQSNLSVRSAGDTLSIPLAVEPLVVVDRAEAGDYKERVSGAKVERRRSYEIKIKNNKEFPVSLTVKDQYPVSNTDEVEVTLEESTGAQVDAASGMLTWKQELAPGEAKTLVFTYSVRYPKEGTITGYY